MRRLAQSALLFLLVFGVATASDARRRKKFIATGWDQADTQRLRDNLAEMESRPFDGVVISIRGHIDEKRRCTHRAAFVNQKWERDWFQHCIRNLKACKFRRFTDNFILLGANPGNVDWFDDAGWQQIVDHWRITAWITRQSGTKGILFDPEPYAKPHAQFRYDAQPQHDKHTFTEYCAKARERGRAVMQAIVAEHPDITLYTYFMHSVNAPATGQQEPRRVLRTLGYGLYPAFIDGWLDVLPPTVTLVDGCESAYRFNSVRDYLEAGVLIKGAAQELVSPENRAKYRAHTQVSFGVYLDAYWNPKDSEWGAWHIDGLGQPRVQRLRANVRTALRVADEYVWIYGEKFRWWPTPNGRVRPQTWPEALPGIDKALGIARDPLDYARTQIAAQRKAGTLVNLARNGDFASSTARTSTGAAEDWKSGGAPAGWHFWQVSDSKGTFTWDKSAGAKANGSARAAACINGCFIQSHPVEPGQAYAVRCARKCHGAGDAWIRVRWQTAEGKWTAQQLDKMIYTDGPRDRWQEMFGVVEIPEGVGRLVILLGVGGQKSADDVIWFDDVVLYKID
ncbi:hypothetical protein HQ576_15820 [bacterium]|nr:hypothetical protein [bacterium]